jgi:lipoprotein-anchoring transpeptidase ErfK/SrfK
VRWVLHTSTGANGYTHDGLYRFFRQIDGYSGGRLYYPSYFDGRRAIHGWPEVPTYPASHGCARIPMWAAEWMNGRIRIGMRVAVYH